MKKRKPIKKLTIEQLRNYFRDLMARQKKSVYYK